MSYNGNDNSKLVIAIDGPAGAGKSTVAKKIALQLTINYLDTGAMYRALTFKALQEGIGLEDEDALVELANRTVIDVRNAGEKVEVILDGKNVSEEIRTQEVTNKTFYIARAPRVRAIMVDWQRKIASTKSIIADGRDTTTVVFPNATNKFYLDAKIEERTNRRLKEMVDKGKEVDENQLKEEMKDRDNKDFSRTVGPLKKAADAVYIDSTDLTIEQVVGRIIEHIKQ